MELHDLRRSYTLDTLTEENLNLCPFDQFDAWLKAVIDAKIPDPTAMVLSTVDSQNKPTSRIVLLKDRTPDGFVFFTNYASRKAKSIEDNPHVCLHFPWHFMERQVSVTGRAVKISKADSLKYFLSRPKDSQLAAWASHQSQRISSRQALMQQFESLKQKFKTGDLPLPDFWGGYKVIPETIEFWQGGENRLHDRFIFEKAADESWQVSRLQP